MAGRPPAIIDADSPPVKMLDFDWPRGLQALDLPNLTTNLKLPFLLVMLTPPLGE